MEKNPLVSVLIPVYNSSNFLRQCLDSVCNQSYQNLQVVIINDGSTDKSNDICNYYAKNYSFIEYYYQQNLGVSSTRNRLLELAKGEFILFVDSDDWIELNMVNTLVTKASCYNACLVICDYVNSTSKSKIVRKDELWNQEDIINYFLFHKRVTGCLTNKLIRKDILQGIEFDSEISYGEDALFCWDVLQRVRLAVNTNIPLYNYRINPNSLSHQKFDSRRLSGQVVWERIYEGVVENWSKFEGLTKANRAVAYFWLLIFAATDKYPKDHNIIKFQCNLRKSIFSILKFRLLSLKSYIVALLFTIDYNFAMLIMNPVLRNWKR